MRLIKAFAVVVLISFSLDAAFWEGAYRRHIGRNIQDTAHSVSSLDWNNLDDV